MEPVNFIYREVPQTSNRFVSFELLYRRTVRGAMHILRELWRKEVEEPDVKSSYEYVLDLRERLKDILQIACKGAVDGPGGVEGFLSLVYLKQLIVKDSVQLDL
ncbi:Zinc finger protein [Plakobranchus ocellatus]|uniref:Zinc finger protein n=1 Tax=Plakobranchus ocellatus TaxID=259542 RepID=A0AAV3YRY5_9GAST|nr:Zinc finger protein [Plakobranchus ocellatus]